MRLTAIKKALSCTTCARVHSFIRCGWMAKICWRRGNLTDISAQCR